MLDALPINPVIAPSADQIVFTHTDESSGLSAAHFMPIAGLFFRPCAIEVVERDISLTTRLLQALEARDIDPATKSIGLDDLGRDLTDGVMIVKYPNISATKEQLVEAINELRSLGFSETQVPNYPEGDKLSQKEQELKNFYDKQIIGSVVNPFLRRGNSVRGMPPSVKEVAQQSPHVNTAWSSASKTQVRSMESGDYYETERSAPTIDSQTAKIVFFNEAGQETILAKGVKFDSGIVDTAVMDRAKLGLFLDEVHVDARKEEIAIVHMLKATMMVASDGPVFGDAVASYYRRAIDQHSETLAQLNFKPADGIVSLIRKLKEHPHEKEILKAFARCREDGPALPLLDKTGKLHLGSSSDVLIDAAMASLARHAGMLVQGGNGTTESSDVIAVVPDRTFGKLYVAGINDLKLNGAIEPATAGSIVNVGLMAADKYGTAAEEYGSKATTFQAPGKGTIKVVLENSDLTIDSLTQAVKQDDIYRLCRTSSVAVNDWAELTIQEAKAQSPGRPALLLLDNERAHDRAILAQIRAHLAGLKCQEGEDFIVKSPDEGIVVIHDFMRHNSNDRLVVGTGNVLRDYLTDWTPVLEAGTANMLTSQVGANLHETGAGGTAPDLMQNALNGNQFKWSGMGEYLATAEALRGLEARGNQKAGVLARTLDGAIKGLLNEEGPLPKIDTRYQQGRLAQIWAERLATQSENMELAKHFTPIAEKLAEIVPDMKGDFLALADSPQVPANDRDVHYGLSQRPEFRDALMRSRLKNAMGELAAA